MADNQAPLIPEEASPQPEVMMLSAMANISGWDIGPGRESTCQLKLTLTVKDFENAKLLRDLSRGGQVVLRLMPLQQQLPVSAEGCQHTGMVLDLGLYAGVHSQVCMSCGLVMPVPQDDAPAAPEGQDGAPAP
jgi:hypothetical protein